MMELILFILVIWACSKIGKHIQANLEEKQRIEKAERTRQMIQLRREQEAQAREQARQAQEQVRLAKEQEKQAEVIRKHEERLAKLEEKATIACYTIEHYEPMLESLYEELEKLEKDAEFSKDYYPSWDDEDSPMKNYGSKSCEKKAQQVRNKIYAIDLKLAKARSAMAEYERAKETA